MTEQQPAAGWYPDPSGAGRQKYWDGQKWTDGPPPKPKPQGFSRKTILFGVLAVFVVVAIISAFGGGGDNSSPSSASSTSVPSAPAYRLEAGEKPSTLNVYVPKLPTAGQTSLIVEDLQNQYSDRDDGYFVRIYCESSSELESGNILANARFAVGNIGAARTGLDDGDKEIKAINGAQCPLKLAQALAGALSAQQVLDAILAAGLPATDPRDNSANGACQDNGCVQLITTDDFSIYQFVDALSAQKWADAFSGGYLNGLIFLRYNDSGSHPTDPAMIPEYNRVLDNLQEGN
ncbi:DUF2510 domain-containing protein [Mycolicibacterium sp. A43C]